MINQFIIDKSMNKITSILTLVLTFVLNSCSSDDYTMSNFNVAALRFEITESHTRASINTTTMTTVFTVGDKAGVFGVKNGYVVEDLNNLPLTLNQSGFWSPATSLNYSVDMADIKFYAYFPYNENITFDASSETPFSEYINSLQVPLNQENVKNFNSADIMVTGACTVDTKLHYVKLNMTHVNCMVNVELPNSSYVFTNQGMEPYVLTKAENVQFKLGGKIVKPYFDTEIQSYRLIVKANTSETLNVSYTDGDRQNNATINNLANINKGEYADYVIDGGVDLVSGYNLQVGDYYLSTGKLVSKDAELTAQQKAMVIGVVAKLGTTDGISSSYKTATHAIVLSLNNGSLAAWGDYAATTSAENNAGWRNWWIDYGHGLANQNTTSAGSLKEDTFAEIGFEDTHSWMSVSNPLVIGGYTHSYNCVMIESYNIWCRTTVAPDITSGWYLPSLRDHINIEANRTAIDASLAKPQGDKISPDLYWSTSLRAAGSNWCYSYGKTALADRYKGVGLKDKRLYRYLLAF